MVHIGDGPPTIDEVVPLLRPGDILTHCFTGGDMRIVDDAGAPNPAIKELHDRGLILDIGHGTGSFSFETAEAMLEARAAAGRDLAPTSTRWPSRGRCSTCRRRSRSSSTSA